MTEIKLDWTGRKLSVVPVSGETALIPQERTWKIELHKITSGKACVLVNGKEQEKACRYEGTTLTVLLERVRPEDAIEIILPADTEIAGNPVLEMIYDFLNQAEIGFRMKDEIYETAKRNTGNPAALSGELAAQEVPEKLQRVIMEIAGARV